VNNHHTRRQFIHQAGPPAWPSAWAARPGPRATGRRTSSRSSCPTRAGGATDILARLISRGLATRLGQQVLVDNRAGAGGMIGTGAMAKSAPDGYTFGIILVSTVITAPFLFEKVPYDTDRDIGFVTLLATVPWCWRCTPACRCTPRPS